MSENSFITFKAAESKEHIQFQEESALIFKINVNDIILTRTNKGNNHYVYEMELYRNDLYDEQ